MAQALQHRGQDQAAGLAAGEPQPAAKQVAAQQMALYGETGPRSPVTRRPARSAVNTPPLCAGCRAREARYGFRPEGVEAGAFDRPRTLCFDCFRVELTRRQQVRERMARGWNGQQVGLPLEDTLRALDQRRRRAQIAARHALDEATAADSGLTECSTARIGDGAARAAMTGQPADDTARPARQAV